MTFIHPLNISLSIKDIAAHIRTLSLSRIYKKKTTLLPLSTKSYIFIDLTDTEKNLINHKGLRQCNELDGLAFPAFSFIKMKNKSISLCEFICKMRRAYGGLVVTRWPKIQVANAKTVCSITYTHIRGITIFLSSSSTLKIGT